VLEQVDEFRPDAVIIDLGLPGKTGYEVATLLRAHPDFRRLPLIALSGYGQPSDMERSRSVGFNFHLLKPADPKLLMRLIETAESTPGSAVTS
jgi:two-component system CheB/CheR fusion protein